MCQLQGSYERMASKLKPLGIYRLSGTTLMDYELKSYATYIDMLESQIGTLFASCFVDEITMDNCDSIIKLFALPARINLQTLKRIVKARMGICNSDFTMEGVKRCLEAGGFTAQIAENFATNTITVTIISDLNLFSTQTEKHSYIKQCMPCHANVSIVG